MDKKKRNKEKNIYLIAGGGTGGHLFPAIAIAQQILRKDPVADIHFVGTKRGLEAKVIPDLGYHLHFSTVRGVRRTLSLKNLLVPFALIWSLLQSLLVILKLQPVAVIGTGGYVSGPVLYIAGLLGRITVIQEQNSYPGVTTRLLAKRVDRVYISFKEATKYLKKKDNIELVGNPVRDLGSGLQKEQARQQYHLRKDRLTVLVFGGSQGAVAINRAVLDCLDNLIKTTDYQIIWSTGQIGYNEVKDVVQKYSDRIYVSKFITDMASAYSASDLVISRAGALTLAEITVSGLPSILIPYPYAAEGHQEFNARALYNMGAAELILEEELGQDVLAGTIKNILTDTDKREKMCDAARAAGFPNATADMVASLFKLIEYKAKDKR